MSALKRANYIEVSAPSKKEKYGWTEAQFEEYNKSRSCTKENFIIRYGKEEGLKKWESYCEKQAYTNTLEYFIEREGSFEKGLEIYNNINKGKKTPHNALLLSERLHITIDQACQIISERKNNESFISDGEKTFITDVELILGRELKYTYKTRQFCIWSNDLQTPLFYDACCTEKKKILEYNGDYWHANPLRYVDSFIIKQTGKSAKEIRERDLIKIKNAENRGFDVLVIWESEYIEDRDKTLTKIKEWYER